MASASPPLPLDVSSRCSDTEFGCTTSREEEAHEQLVSAALEN
jgi:hypothetical protein